MARKLNWERCTRQVRARRNGSTFAFVDLPATGSIADRGRKVSSATAPMRRDRANAVPIEPVPGKRVSAFSRLQLLTGLVANANSRTRSSEANASMIRHLATAVREAQQLTGATLKPSRQRILERAIAALSRFGNA